MIQNPAADDLLPAYLDPEDQMPAFQAQLSENDLTTLVRYLQDDYTKCAIEMTPPGDRQVLIHESNYEFRSRSV